MNEKEKLLNELFNLSQGKNVADLIIEFEINFMYNTKLKYKDIYKIDDNIIIKVYDEISECPFELVFNKEKKLLEVY